MMIVSMLKTVRVRTVAVVERLLKELFTCFEFALLYR